MQFALIATKLNPPPVQRELVERPRLIDALNRGVQGKLTLISTPAGYGKTMLLSAWVDQCRLPVAWISLDEGDNDPARFLLYLVAALDKIIPGAGSSITAALQSPHLPAQEHLLSSLLNEISQHTGSFVLVLDDYHLVHEQVVHTAVITLLKHLPPQMHLVIASRSDPPLQLARLRGRSELTELRLADLRFTQNEARQFLYQIMRLGLADEQVAALTARTEGWIAGLQMAAISLKAVNDQANFIRSFSGSHRFILDYLVEEVLKGQAQEVQTFLLQTSILNRLSGALCDAVTGLQNSQEILEDLERANLFIIPLDEERMWYRYHQLFLDLLRKRAQQQFPGRLADWQGRASLWYETQGNLDGAIEHALAAGDSGRAADLMTATAQATLMRSEIYTFQGWINRLPEEDVRARPDLMLYYTWTLVLNDADAETVEACLNRVAVSSQGIASKIEVIRGYREYMLGEVQRAVLLLQHGLAGLPAEAILFRGVAGWLLSLYYVTMGDFRTGAQALEEVIRTSLQKNHTIIAAGALCALAEIHMRLGQLHEAKDNYEQALSIAGDAQGRLPIAARALMGLGDLWREWNEPQQALRYCSEGIELAKYLRASTAISGHITLARVHHASGNWQLSQAAMQKAWELARQTEQTGLDDIYVGLVRANLAILRGDVAAAGNWVEERGLAGEIDLSGLDEKEDYYKFHLLKYELLVVGRWLIASNQSERALQLLNPFRARVHEYGRVQLEIEALVLIALAYQDLGNHPQAMDSFERCLVMARPGGYVRMFLDQGPAIRPLLQQATRGQIASDYAGWLLSALEAENPPDTQAEAGQQKNPQQSAGLVEPLSERELQLLTLIAAGLSNQEIARRLFISLPTVKWHTSNIYGKLGVRSRTQAVLQARALGILATGS